jgi:hypothetical protein
MFTFSPEDLGDSSGQIYMLNIGDNQEDEQSGECDCDYDDDGYD